MVCAGFADVGKRLAVAAMVDLIRGGLTLSVVLVIQSQGFANLRSNRKVLRS